MPVPVHEASPLDTMPIMVHWSLTIFIKGPPGFQTSSRSQSRVSSECGENVEHLCSLTRVAIAGVLFAVNISRAKLVLVNVRYQARVLALHHQIYFSQKSRRFRPRVLVIAPANGVNEVARHNLRRLGQANEAHVAGQLNVAVQFNDGYVVLERDGIEIGMLKRFGAIMSSRKSD